MSLQHLSWPRPTARLILRPVVASDIDPIWAWHRLPEVTALMPRLSDDHDAFAAHILKWQEVILVAVHQSRPVAVAKIAVGDAWAQAEVAARAAGTMAEIGWALDPVVQGQGFGTELAGELLAICFDGLGVRRVVAECVADNIASWRIMEKVGMRREGDFRANALLRDGTWHDSLSYGLLATEWAQRHRATP